MIVVIIYKVISIAGLTDKTLIAMLCSLICSFLSYACLCMFNNAIYLGYRCPTSKSYYYIYTLVANSPIFFLDIAILLNLNKWSHYIIYVL